MANRVWLLAPLLMMAGGTFAGGQDSPEPNKSVCNGRVESVQQCHWIDGTVSIYNGTPAIRIHQHRSKHVYGVGPSEQEWMPSDLKSKLTVSNAIDAKFKICPINKHKPNQNGLTVVCIDEAKIQKIKENQ